MADELMRRLKEKSWGQDVFKPDDWTDYEPLAKPKWWGADAGHHLR
jgi:hypothetical protein